MELDHRCTIGSLWQKKDNSDFDVTMGSLDGAELAESVGLYLLYRLREVDMNVEVGLYRDDGLGAVDKVRHSGILPIHN